MSLDIYLKLYLRKGNPCAAFYCLPQSMATRRLPNLLEDTPQTSGLSQSDVSFLIRLKDKSELSRYERNVRLAILAHSARLPRALRRCHF